MPDIYTAPKKHKKNHLSAFVVKPNNVRFETQEKKEKIVLLLRQHWFTNLSWILLAILMLFAPFFLRFFWTGRS